VKHDFGFTPSFSMFVDFESEEQLRHALHELGQEHGGDLLMPLDNYGFSTLFAWVKDRFGVSWQLNLP
jgi:predicted 3-demethylubiquinone-9 3-methyltransferase (glyoxalase superfamily)